MGREERGRRTVTGRPDGATGREPTLVRRDSPDDIGARREAAVDPRAPGSGRGTPGSDPRPREDH